MSNLQDEQEASGSLLKRALADRLRERIVNGELAPGQRIVEGKWAREFGVAQASIREANNILAHEGFVTKDPGRSARVITFSKNDVLHLYEIRGAFEGLAGRLATQHRSELKKVRQALAEMQEAVRAEDPRALLDADLRFHLELCGASGNPFVVEQARRVLLPFFAFVRIQVAATHQRAVMWDRDLDAHQRIIDLIQDGEADVAEQYIRRAMQRFAHNAYESWDHNHAGEPKHKGARSLRVRKSILSEEAASEGS